MAHEEAGAMAQIFVGAETLDCWAGRSGAGSGCGPLRAARPGRRCAYERLSVFAVKGERCHEGDLIGGAAT